MIYGIGIDLVNILRLKSADEKWGKRFIEKIFTEREIAYCYEKKEPYPSLAVRFAAKEAFIKAIGSEIPVILTNIEVMNDESGKPSIHAKGKVKEFLTEKSIRRCHLSLSHEKEFGIACVVLEQ